MVVVVPYIRSVVCHTSLVLPPRIHGEDGAQTDDLWPSGNLLCSYRMILQNTVW